MADEDRVLEVVERRNAAVAHGDAEAVIDPLCEDIVSYTLAPPLAYSGAQARDVGAIKRWLATWNAPPEIELREPTVLVDGDLAVVFGFAAMRGTKVGGYRDDLWYRTTIVLTRKVGDWYILHEHESVPFLMDGSDKAAVDLEP